MVYSCSVLISVLFVPKATAQGVLTPKIPPVPVGVPVKVPVPQPRWPFPSCNRPAPLVTGTARLIPGEPLIRLK